MTLSDVVRAVKHLLTPKNPQVQPHAVLQWLTREFDVDMPRVRLLPHINLVRCYFEYHDFTVYVAPACHPRRPTKRCLRLLNLLHHALQDLCVKVEFTEGIVRLVTDIQREEELATRAAREKMLQEVHQNASKLEVCLSMPAWTACMMP